MARVDPAQTEEEPQVAERVEFEPPVLGRLANPQIVPYF